MNPAFSVIFFTTIAGVAQGLVAALALAALAGVAVAARFEAALLAAGAVLLVIALACSFLHLGRPGRAWRAATMWRTSWLSREVIVLPAFIATVAVWCSAVASGASAPWTRVALPLGALALAALLWLCTAMIYACLRFVEEWAHPLTLASLALIGASSGLLVVVAAASVVGEGALQRAFAIPAVVATVLAGAVRWSAIRRNDRLRHRSTLQSATGLRGPRVVQMSMGFTAGSFNTREFFHGMSPTRMLQVRSAAMVLGFALPALLASFGVATGSSWPWLLASAVQAPGLVADRWFFFAQAKHPQNLYYQSMS